MCLGVPGRITMTWREGAAIFADVDHLGQHRKASLNYLPDLDVGDLVLVHAGYAMSKLSEQSAQEVVTEMCNAGLIELDESGRLVGAEDSR